MTEQVVNYKERIEQAIHKAERETSSLSFFAREIFGLTSPRVKHLINNLCNYEDVKYIEFGIYRSATLIAAGSSKCKVCFGVDNFSYNPYEGDIWNPLGWPSVRNAAHDNIERVKLTKKVVIKELDFNDTTTDLPTLFNETFNLIHVDIDSFNQEQMFNLLTRIKAIAENKFLLIMSNYHEKTHTIKAVEDFITKSRLKLSYKNLLISQARQNSTGWWSGVGLFVLEKPAPVAKSTDKK